MEVKNIFFTFLVTIQLSYGVIYRLNDTEYLRMPPLYRLDDYDSCVYQPNGTYCFVEIELVSDTPSDLLQMIHEYSEHYTTHFNHTRLNHGICATKTCKQFADGNITVDQKTALEGCLNESLWRDYKLKSHLTQKVYCTKLDDNVNINAGDICAAVFFISLLVFNIIGSLYDVCYVKQGEGNRLLLCFSLKRNWKKLTSQENEDQSRKRLRGVHGLRALCVMLVIFSHAPLHLILSPENPHGFEKTYYNLSFHIFYNGTQVVQTFYMIAGCLMAYNISAYAEKNQLRWTMIPKGIIIRWLRITPAYAVMIIFSITWMRFAASGPMWKDLVVDTAEDCYRYGWWNMIYLNNYIDNSKCMIETWYLASDMQLYILGVFVCILAKTAKCKKIVLSIIYIIGCLLPGIATYLLDLDNVLVFPESLRNYFIGNPTFNHSYKRGHTNIPNFILGLALGNLFYQGLKDKRSIEKFKKLGVLYYFTVPVGFAFFFYGVAFYGDRPRPSIYIRAVLACFLRPVYGLLLALLLIGMVFKFENLYRKILEWCGWRIPARVSYSAFLLHSTIIRIYAGKKTTLTRVGMAECFKEVLAVTFMTFLIAYPFWLIVEAPLNGAILNIFGLANNDKRKDTTHKLDKVNGKLENKYILELDSGENKDNYERMRLKSQEV